MKTAISIPDQLFQSAEKLARRLSMSRSELYAKAVSEYLHEHKGKGVTEKLNAVYGNVDSELETDVYSMQFNSLEDGEW
jgi:metal-responsive CopG/Arc/MetJ family transcriptional regulator